MHIFNIRNGFIPKCNVIMHILIEYQNEDEHMEY